VELKVSQSLQNKLNGRSLLTLKDLSTEEIRFFLDETKNIRKNREKLRNSAPLFGKSLIMLFEKRSTRTRVSTELAMSDLGGKSIILSLDDIHLGTNESIRDTATVLGRMASGILARVYRHEDLDELNNYANVPVINALSDKCHPLQGLADLFTIESHFKNTKEIKIAWVGDGNNVCHSLMIAAAKMDISITIASPSPHQPLQEVVDYCREIASANIAVVTDPREAISQANVIVTDTFISMGQEAQRESKLQLFHGYQVNTELAKHAKSDYIFMHCLPRHHEEVTDEIFYGPHSVVFEEAENRLYTVAAVLKNLL
jgi:ornithine carbamoyltransferase